MKDEKNSTHGVFERLLKDIIQGNFGSPGRLPAERTLAADMNTSRATLREALQKLTAWNLVEPRRGSGITVLERNAWSIEVLPAYLRYGGEWSENTDFLALIKGMLAVRRSVLVELVKTVNTPLPEEALRPAVMAMRRAWEGREDPSVFVAADFDMVRAILDAAGLLPGVWLLNRMEGIYMELAHEIVLVTRLPEGYRSMCLQVFAALKQGNGTLASEHLEQWLIDHDALIFSGDRA